MLEEFHSWLERIGPDVVPSSRTGQAIAYALKEWGEIFGRTYIEDRTRTGEPLEVLVQEAAAEIAEQIAAEELQQSEGVARA